MKSFDRKFGADFLARVPASPGIYTVFNPAGEIIYVGKAKHLRRRLAQYRNAKRCQKHAKMRSIIAEAARLELEVVATDLEASLLEARRIQDLRPKWNVAGAFYFLYPMVGMRGESDQLSFCYTTQPDYFPDFTFHGAYRSREITGNAFFSLMKLLGFVGHARKGRREGIPKFSYVFEFRRLPESWREAWDQFWKGESNEVLEALVLALLENAGARSDPGTIQAHLNDLRRFWRHEAARLSRARKLAEHVEYPVAQKERDLLFLKYRALAKERRAIAQKSFIHSHK